MKFRRFRLKKIRKNPESGKKPGFSDTKRFASVFGVRCRLCETGDVGAMLFTWPVYLVVSTQLTLDNPIF